MNCQVHRYHRPRPLRIVTHHLQPLGMGGLDVPANRISTCDTGHFDIHRKLGELLRDGRMTRGGGRNERKFAQQGYDAWVTAGKPGKPVYELHPEETR
jgi:hypothetical protein